MILMSVSLFNVGAEEKERKGLPPLEMNSIRHPLLEEIHVSIGNLN